jgi:hypothetical protein
MTWHPNSSTHKAKHGGYRQKPTKEAVRGLMNLYACVATETKQRPAKKVEGSQLKFDF